MFAHTQVRALASPLAILFHVGIPRLSDAIGLDAEEEHVAMEEDRFIAAGRDLDRTLSSSFLFLYLLRHCGAAYQTEIQGAASGADMADIEQMKKIVPLITCEISFGQYVCELVCGVNETDLDLGVQIDLVKQPIKSNSVGP